jgi:hypothetical protein
LGEGVLTGGGQTVFCRPQEEIRVANKSSSIPNETAILSFIATPNFRSL